MKFFWEIRFQILVILILLLPLTHKAQDAGVNPESGKLIPKVAAKSNAAQSYALYLPTNYTPNKKWSILYAFDPSGRGNIPVEIFQTAAEKYGVIVVGSNKSQNGLDGNALTVIFQTLWEDTHQRFSIDDRRVYATGFSGGARVASLLSAFCGNCVTGVISGGAGFSSQIKPNAQLLFTHYGIVGVDDFDYAELYTLEKSLSEAKISHRIETISGGHEWFSKEAAEHALGWMELQAIKKGLREKDEKLIDEILTFRTAEAKSLLAANQIFQAYQAYSFLIEDFKDLRNLYEFTIAIAKFNQSELLKAQQSEEEQIAKQRENEKQFYGLLAAAASQEERILNQQALNSFISNLKKKAAQTDESAERRVARRSLAGFFVGTIESARMNYKPKKQYLAAAANLEIAVKINPQSPGVWLELAKIYALDGQKKKALSALEEAVKNNLKDASLLENSFDLDSIREEARFRIILANLKSK